LRLVLPLLRAVIYILCCLLRPSICPNHFDCISLHVLSLDEVCRSVDDRMIENVSVVWYYDTRTERERERERAASSLPLPRSGCLCEKNTQMRRTTYGTTAYTAEVSHSRSGVRVHLLGTSLRRSDSTYEHIYSPYQQTIKIKSKKKNKFK